MLNSREENEKKYGKKEDDHIARIYRDSKEQGDSWCLNNTNKYTKRFMSVGSKKSGQLIDLLKARDYLDRCIEQNTPPEEVKAPE